MTRTIQLLSLLIMLCLLVTAPTIAAPQQPEPEEPTQTEGEDASAEDEEAEGRGGRDGDEPDGIQPYDEVITDEAVSDEGVFTVHQIDDRYYYEIPASEIGREFLWVARIAKTIVGQGYGGQKFDSRVVKWERRGERVFLRNVSYEIVADQSLPIAKAVRAANSDTILMAFDIAALGENESVVIDITDLFATEVPELSARSRLEARGFDRRRSFVDRVVSFPENIEVRAVHTYTRPPDTNAQGQGRRGPTTTRRGMAPGSATLEMAYSMMKLPEDPMMPRLFDDRVDPGDRLCGDGLRQPVCLRDQRVRLERRCAGARQSALHRAQLFQLQSP